MKRGTTDHPKTLRLAKLLQIERWGAVGILESLWHFTARHAIRGDIGRWSDEDICEAIGWEQEPGKLIDALVEAGWLDRDEVHRLLVHDWHDHADDTVKKTLRNRQEAFATLPENSGNVRKIPETSGKFRKRLEMVAPAIARAVARAEPSQSLGLSQKIAPPLKQRQSRPPATAHRTRRQQTRRPRTSS